MQAENYLAVFSQKADELVRSKLILFNQNVASVLQCVVSTPILTGVLSETSKRCSYVNEFLRAKIMRPQPDGTVTCQFKLPQDNERAFTLVVCLLAEFDGGRRNLSDFLKEFFPFDDANKSFDAFRESVLVPFKEIGEKLLQKVAPDDFDSVRVAEAEKYFESENCYFSQQTAEMLLELIGILENGANCDEQTEMAKALRNAVYLKNTKLLKIIWIGFKNTFDSKQNKSALDEISKLLSGII